MMPRPVPLSPGAALVAVLLVAAQPSLAQVDRVQPEDCPPGSITCGVLGGALGGILGDLMRQVDPWLADLAEMLGDLSGWHAPEVLENGDILIRRRQPAETAPPVPTEDDESPVTVPLEL